MRKFYLLNWMLLLIGLISSTAFGQTYTEDFETQTALDTGYKNGSFEGAGDVTFTYVHSRNEALGTSDDSSIDGKGIMLRRADEPSSIEFTLPNGVTNLSFDYRKAFTGGSNNRQLAVFVNGVQEYVTPMFGTSGTDTTVHTFNENIDEAGAVTIKITYPTGTATGNKQITIDNISWTEPLSSCEASNIAFANTTVNKDLLDPSFTQTATSLNGTTAITYESSDELVATVNATTGEVSLVGVGTATITASQAAGEHSGVDYCAGTATYDVVVTTSIPVLTVSANSASFSGFAGGAVATETITVEGLNLTGDIALALSGDTNFSINPTSLSSTGGEVTITYTPSATPATHSATLTVSNGLLSEVITLSGVTNEMPEEYAGVGTFEKITSTDDLTDGYYVVANETSEFVMTNVNSGYFVSETANLTNSTFVNPSTSIVWKIETNGSGKTIYNEVSEKYVGWTSGNSASEASTVSDNTRWTFSYADDKFTVNNVATPARQLSYNSQNPRFAAYGNTGQQELQLYKLVESASTTWNGTAWSNGVPTIDVDAIVDGALEISADLAAKSVTVNTNGSVVVKSGNALTVDGAIVNNATAAAFVVENDANLIQVQDVANTGEFTVYRNSNPMVRNDMTLWSSPVANQSLRSFSPETLYNRFWTYNEGTNAYQALFTADTQDQDFESGLGYAIRVKNTLPTGETTVHEGAFTGNLNNGDVAVNTVVTTSGNNLVGNPYPSNIAVQGTNGFLTANAHVNALYFWTQTYPVGSPNYNNNYQAYSLAGSTLGDVENISVGQGFIVNVDNPGQVVFNNAMRTSDASTFYRTEIEKNRMWLSLTKDEEKLNQILVAYMTDATNELDHQIDAKVFTKGQASIYTLINNEAYAIQGRALPFDQEDVVALGFEATEQGTYSINIEAVDGLFAEGQEVYLLDKSLNKIHDLATAYTFESEAGIFDERFEVVYGNRDLGLNTDLTNSKDVVVYTDNNTIVVESKNAQLVSVELIDLQGRTVAAKNNIKANTYRVNTSAKGVLVVKIQTADGNVITKKVIRK